MKTFLKMLFTWLFVALIGGVISSAFNTYRIYEENGESWWHYYGMDSFYRGIYWHFIMGGLALFPGMVVYHIIVLIVWKKTWEKWAKKSMLSAVVFLIILYSQSSPSLKFFSESMVTLKAHLLPFLIFVWLFEYPSQPRIKNQANP